MSAIPAFEKYQFEIAWPQEGNGEGYTITFPTPPGYIASGATEQDAIAQARSASHAWTASTVENRKTIPLPHSATRTANDSSDALSLDSPIM